MSQPLSRSIYRGITVTRQWSNLFLNTYILIVWAYTVTHPENSQILIYTFPHNNSVTRMILSLLLNKKNYKVVRVV